MLLTILLLVFLGFICLMIPIITTMMDALDDTDLSEQYKNAKVGDVLKGRNHDRE